jgi:hypothetical protein
MIDLLTFRRAVGAHLGQTLTPELAALIETQARQIPDRSIDASAIAVMVHGAYTFQAEWFSEIIGELEPLHEAHWLETERHRHGLALQPDYDAVIGAERAGHLLQFTIRQDGALIGHCRMYVRESVHTSTRYADEDTLFILPEHRGGLMVIAFMRYVEAALRTTCDVREIRANSKLVNKADVLMKRLGYTPVALQFVKLFKEKSDVL